MTADRRFTVSGAYSGKVYAMNVERDEVVGYVAGPRIAAVDALEVGERWCTEPDCASGLLIVRTA